MKKNYPIKPHVNIGRKSNTEAMAICEQMIVNACDADAAGDMRMALDLETASTLQKNLEGQKS